MLNHLTKKKSKRLLAAIAAATLVFSNASYFSIVKESSIVSAATGEYKSWKQSDPRWSRICLGSSSETMSQSGCAVTSLAILLVHSGCLDENEFNPGTFCNFLSNNGGLDYDANLYWGAVSKLVPDFTFEGTAYLNGSTEEEKTNEIKSYLDQGYYLIADVKYSGHWVAIDKVEDGIVYSIDPASYTTPILFDQYNFRGSTRVKLFRKGSKPIVNTTPVQSSEDTEEETNYEEGTYKTTSKLNFRSASDVSSKIMDVIDNHTVLEITEVSGKWGKTSYGNKTGWVCLDYAEYIEAVAEEEEETVVEEISAPAEEIPETKVFTAGVYEVNDIINFRKGPGKSNDTYGLITNDTEVKVTEISDNWGKINHDGKTGWICLDYADYIAELSDDDMETELKEEENAENAAEVETEAKDDIQELFPEAEGEYSIYVTNDYLNFRKGPGLQNTVMEVVPADYCVIVTDKVENWGKIEYNGNEGWICLDYAECIANIEDIKPEEETAVSSNNTLVELEDDELEEILEKAEDIVVPEISAAVEEEEEEFKGDLNFDGIINAADLVKLVSIILEGNCDDALVLNEADLNNDGRISAVDVVSLKHLIVNNY